MQPSRILQLLIEESDKEMKMTTAQFQLETDPLKRQHLLVGMDAIHAFLTKVTERLNLEVGSNYTPPNLSLPNPLITLA